MRRTLQSKIFCLLAVMWMLTISRAAFADKELALPPGSGTDALSVRVSLARAEVRYRVCPLEPCLLDDGAKVISLADQRSWLPAEADISVERVPVGPAKALVHVRIPLKGTENAWEGLFVGRKDPILFQGLSGFSQGEAGAREGKVLAVLPRDAASKYVIVGTIREDNRICGQPWTMLSPMGFDPASLSWRGATIQRLAPEQRSRAMPLTLRTLREPPPPPLVHLLRAMGSSSGPGYALTDGNLETVWTEGRPGVGQGEYVIMQAPRAVSLKRLVFTVSPVKPWPQGAAPRTAFVVSDSRLYAVTFPEDGWKLPLSRFELSFVEPLSTSCLAVVLDDAFDRGLDGPQVSLTELTAYSEFDGSEGLANLVTSLDTNGAKGLAAAAMLERAKTAAVEPLRTGYGKLSESGRTRALAVAAALDDCAGAPILVQGLREADKAVAERARTKLERCGKKALPAYVEAMKDDWKAKLAVAPLFALADGDAALEALSPLLGQGTPAERAILRDAVAHAARSAPSTKLAALFERASAQGQARIELLRALGPRVVDLPAQMVASLRAVFASGADMPARYIALEPLSALTAHASELREEYMRVLLRDPDAAVRARASELAGRFASSALGTLLDDQAPRVRVAALRSLSRHETWNAKSLTLLSADPWPFVREAAARHVILAPPEAAGEAALVRALGSDASPRVRVATAATLGEMKRGSAALVARLSDGAESLDVRLAAMQSLEKMCAQDAAPVLARLARGLTGQGEEAELAVAAFLSLARMNPAAFQGAAATWSHDKTPQMRALVQRASAQVPTCP